MKFSFNNFVTLIIFYSLLIILSFDVNYNKAISEVSKINILTKEDVKLYRQIFNIQTLPIKNRYAREWKQMNC